MMTKIRLQKFLSDNGILSRRAAEAAILSGRITVNGRPAQLGDKVDPEADIVACGGKTVRPTRKTHTYIMLNKPRGYISAVRDPQGRRCVTDLLTDVHTRVYPVGRLDRVSEGLLLLTDDGTLTNLLTHPGHGIGKLYRVKVGGSVTPAQYEILSSPIVIEGYETRPADVRILGDDENGNTILHITLYEGRNRQIRRLCEAAGLTVRRLIRISIGDLKLNGLGTGKWRPLTPEEVAYLYRTTKG